jgi:hypothetical protein
MAATRLTPGAISVSNSSHLPASDDSSVMKPVIFPPGRGRPATKPEPTGSDTANTIGIVRVSRWSVAVAGDPVALGLVASLNRPGANLTGTAVLTGELAPKRILSSSSPSFLHEVYQHVPFFATRRRGSWRVGHSWTTQPRLA